MALNVQGGLQGAQQGAQIGSMFGGYGAAYGAAAGGILGLFQPDIEKEMIQKWNSQVVKNFSEDLFDLRRVQNIENIRTAQALLNYQDQKAVARASMNANYGAAELLGSSAQALAQTMEFQTQQATAQVWQNYETNIDNMNNTIDQMANQASASLKDRQQGGAQDYSALVKGGIDLYSKLKGKGGTTTQGTSQGGLANMWDLGNTSSGFNTGGNLLG